MKKSSMSALVAAALTTIAAPVMAGGWGFNTERTLELGGYTAGGAAGDIAGSGSKSETVIIGRNSDCGCDGLRGYTHQRSGALAVSGNGTAETFAESAAIGVLGKGFKVRGRR